MSKVLLGVGIISFWLLFGFGMMFLNPSNNTNISNYISQSKEMQQPTFTNFLSSCFMGLVFFFQSMFLWLPNMPFFLTIITNVLQAMSLVFIILTLRG